MVALHQFHRNFAANVGAVNIRRLGRAASAPAW
jgi:hypothetical protein